MTFPKIIGATTLSLAMGLPAWATDYAIDNAGAHAFVQFRVKHLGFSWLNGPFNNFNGSFTLYESDLSKNAASVTIDVTSLDSDHAR